MRGNRQIDFRAFSDAASDGNSAAQALGSLLHSRYSVVMGTPHTQRFVAHAATIILNPHPQLLIAVTQ
jgi:hypothetical protein